ncbi:Ig-like domain-containing protein [candidate division KSB1 bacterium]|nr:Ig-like domain-containing protein [candidate division KSB1 bacterium]
MIRRSVILLFAALFWLSCEESDSVIGSLNHEIGDVQVINDELLADGIAATQIFATVYDKEGDPARGMKVVFTTTHGEITPFAYTDVYGSARARLQSVASRTDLVCTVTAVVVDTSTSGLRKAPATIYRIGLSHTSQTADYTQSEAIQIESVSDNTAKIDVRFIGVTLRVEVRDSLLTADGLSTTPVIVRLLETTSQKGISGADIRLNARLGTLAGQATTNPQGMAQAALTSGVRAETDTIAVYYGNLLTEKAVLRYVAPQLRLTPPVAELIADGTSRLDLTATLLTHKNTPVIGADIAFSATGGIVPETARTGTNGQAKIQLIAGDALQTGVHVIARFYGWQDTTRVDFVQNYPTHINLGTENSFIWVKETGQTEQTDLTAVIVGVNGEPVHDPLRLLFRIINSPGGGERLEPNTGNPLESTEILTRDGRASVRLISGIRSGAVMIRVDCVERPEIAAQSTRIVIRSGPPYMYIDPSDANRVIQHGTVLVEPGKANVAFANPVQEIGITALFADKYNNPVEEGTAVYFTTTGGLITSDAVLCQLGRAGVTLQNANPFPVLYSPDPFNQTAAFFPNPNKEMIERLYPALAPVPPLQFNLPDFEGGQIVNTLGNTGANDGMAIVLALTSGQDQFGNPISVWAANGVIYSTAVHTFTAQTDKTELYVGESAFITIRLFDTNGNPVAAGSSLTASTSKGSLSKSELMPNATEYGYGTTFFSTELTNSLEKDDDPVTAKVTINLRSPNGTGSRSLSIYLHATERP